MPNGVLAEQIDAAPIEAALRAHPLVEDCAVLVRQSVAGSSELVAYVVPSAPRAVERLQPSLDGIRAALPVSIVPVAALPLGPDGLPDEQALARLPVLDADLVRRWEDAVRARAGVSEAAVVVVDQADEPARLHLADLLPGWKAGFQEGTEPRAPAFHAAPASGPRRLARSDGGPLVIPHGAPTTLVEALLRTAELHGDREIVCIHTDGTEVRQTYAGLEHEARRIVAGLRAAGLKAGDRVILQVDSLKEHFSAFWGCALAGVVPAAVAAPPSYSERNSVVNKLHHSWDLLGRPALLTSERSYEQVLGLARPWGVDGLQVLTVESLSDHAPAEAIHPCRPDDVLFYQLTSGSTGIPKCIPETHRAIIRHVHGSQQFNGYTAADVTLNWLPLDHVVPILTFHLKDVYLGCRQIHVKSERILASPLRWLDLMAAHRVTHSWAPNFGFKLVTDWLAKTPGRTWDLSSLKFLMNAGEQVTLPVVDGFLQAVHPFGMEERVMRPAFGMAEVCTCMTYVDDFSVETGARRFLKSSLGGALQETADDDSSAATFVDLGPPMRGVEIRITDASNRPVSEGVVGRLQIRGGVLTPGYLMNEEANREAFVGDGWFNTGDVGFILDGRLTLTGREKEMIIVRGANFYCYEIEDVVNCVPGVEPTFAAACAVDDADTGTEGLAIFFVPGQQTAHDETGVVSAIRAAVSANLGISPAFVVPLARDEFPKTTSGKIQRMQLKKSLLAGRYAERLKQLDIRLGNANTLPDWFFQTAWRRKELVAGVTSTGLALVFQDRRGLGAALEARQEWNDSGLVKVETGADFARLGPRHFRIHPARPDHYRLLFEAIVGLGTHVGLICHLWTYDVSADSHCRRDLEVALESGPISLLLLTQELVRFQKRQQPVRLLAVSGRGQAVLPGDDVVPEWAPLTGLVRTLAQEVPWLDCCHVDLEVEGTDAEAAHVCGEMSAGGDREVAYRRGQRYVPRLEKVDLQQAPTRPVPVRPGGLYLLSGGLGGVGEHLARYLLEHGARLLVVGRTPLEENSPHAEARRRSLRVLEKFGEVRYAAADICDPEALRAAVHQLCTRAGADLDGVFHLAGAYQERLLTDETVESFAGVLAPKVLGAWALHQLVKDLPGCLFVSFSSVTSFFGGAMFGAYAAANRFLESFVRCQRSRHGLDSYCFAWSAWRNLGMSATRDGKQPLRVRGRGFEELSTEQGLLSLFAGLCCGREHLLIGLNAAAPLVRRQLEPAASPAQRLRAFVAGENGSIPLGALQGLQIPDRFGTPSVCDLFQVPNLPRAADGDIDRERLADHGRNGRAKHVPPRSEAERRLVSLWQELLGVAQVGIDDSFFELGGQSLLAAQVISRVREAFGVELPLRTLFETPTVAGLAAGIEAARFGHGVAQAPPLVSVPRASELPLSFAQQRLWFFDQLVPGSSSYNIHSAARLVGPLDVPTLERALGEIVRRHEALRTTFRAEGGQPVQVIAAPGPYRLWVEDLQSTPGQERETRALRLAAAEAQAPFDLATGPLFRCRLVRLDVEDHLFLVTMHHVVSDGWSVGVFARELAALYEAFAAGRPSPLPELPVQYADYTVWQRDLLRGEILEQQLAYWKERLRGAPTLLELPSDRPRPPVQSFRGEHLTFALPRDLTERLEELSRREGATLFMTLMAAFKILLVRYSGQEQLVVSTGVANRDRLETEPLIGCLINILLLRTDLAGNPPFREVLARVREAALGAYAHPDLPFEHLVEALQPERDLSHNPLTQVMFVLLNEPLDSIRLPGLRATPVDVATSATQYDVVVHAWKTPDGLAGFLDYSTDLFDRCTVERMLGHFRTLLEGAATDPGERLLDLPLMTPGERRQILDAWNDTQTDYPNDKCLHELFEFQASRSPRADAVLFGEEHISYAELDRRANQLANYLRKLGVGPDVLVGLSVERSVEMVIGVLGIMKAGGAYVPLDPAYPQERLSFMLQDTRAALLLTQERLVASFRACPTRKVCLDADWEKIAREEPDKPATGVGPDHLGYVIFTSGSTGTPKGISIRHRGVVNNVVDLNRRHGVGANDRMLCLSSLSFDMCVYEIFGTLQAGGAIIMPWPEQLREPAAWAALARQHRVTVWNSAPALLKMFVDYVSGQPELWPRELHLAVLGGDWVPVNLPEGLKAMAPKVRFVVLGGATEASIHSTYYLVTSTAPRWKSIPYGRPMYNQKAYVLNSRLRPQPVGVAGELFLSGIGLGRGYFNRPSQTADRFLPNPFAVEAGERMYRTGDLARWMPDGNLELLGRMDYQVKLRGMRIECGEIEAVLRTHSAVREAVVAAKEHAGDKRLVAYVRPEGSRLGPMSPSRLNGRGSLLNHVAQGLADELRALVRSRLPDYMVPAAVVCVDQLPLSPNGKIDRKALPTPDLASETPGEQLAGSRTPEEEILVGICARVLGLECVSPWANFFELGGHSLLATQVMSQVRDVFGVELPLRSLFESPTVVGLAEHVREARRTGSGLKSPPIVPVARDVEPPLSFAQQRLWFMDQLVPGSASYNIPFAFRLEGGLDTGALEESLAEIVRRHEALRTTFHLAGEQPVQRVAAPGSFELPRTDLGNVPRADREREARRLAAEEARRPFDLARGPLLRTSLVRLDERDHVLLVTLHHVIADGWSLGIFTRELANFYARRTTGRSPALADLPIQYPDYSGWQRDWLQGRVLETHLDYWKRQLAGAPGKLELPLDHPRPAVQTLRGSRYFFELSPGLASKVDAFSRGEGATSFMTLLAVFQALLSGYTGQEDILVGSPFANRTRTETEGLIGAFVNTVVLRTCLCGDPAFRELLDRVRETVLGADAHQDLPFEKVVEAVRPPRDPSRNPLFQVNFRVVKGSLLALELPGLTTSLWFGETVNSKFDLALECWLGKTNFGGFLEYSTDLFEEATVLQMVTDFEELSSALIAWPEVPLSKLGPLARIAAGRRAGNVAATGQPQTKGLRKARRQTIHLGDARNQTGEFGKGHVD
jgi:surfactin family lipopeptide synthetase A